MHRSDFEGTHTLQSRGTRQDVRQILLVIVRPESGNPTKTPLLHHRWSCTGRLSVDVDVDPAVDLSAILIRPRNFELLSNGYPLGALRGQCVADHNTTLSKPAGTSGRGTTLAADSLLQVGRISISLHFDAREGALDVSQLLGC